jgi:hypothetical protein
MGSILGFLVGIGMIFSAWSGELQPWGIFAFIGLTVSGILLFPRTVGTFTSAVMFLSPLAILSGLISGNADSAFSAMVIGIGAFATQWVVGKVRPDSAY